MAAREERGKGVPLTDIERLQRHGSLPLPPRGAGLEDLEGNMLLQGHTEEELAYGLSLMDSITDPGDKIEVSIVSTDIPTEEELAHFVIEAARTGIEISFPNVEVIDGWPTTTFIITKAEGAAPGTTGFPVAALIAIIPTVLIAGLVGFGLFKIEDITKALVPILLITLGGLIILAGVLTRKPVVEAAGKWAERKYQAKNLPREFQFPPGGFPPPKREELPPEFRFPEEEEFQTKCRRRYASKTELISYWTRLGDVAEYEKFDTPFDAGVDVGMRLAGPYEKTLGVSFKIMYMSGVEEGKRHAGVVIAPLFVGNNYISLFRGDSDAQWVADLTEDEKMDFESGIIDGYGKVTPEQLRELAKFEPWRLIELHDDGDLTVKSLQKDREYIVATDGEVFAHYTGTEALKRILSSEYITVTNPGKTTLKKGEVISLKSFMSENERIKKKGEAQASGTYHIEPTAAPDGNGEGKNLLEWLGDSPEFLAYTIDNSGWREQIDSVFQTAIARARG